eukprot:SAG31_NODE_3419_length_4297_cov_1.545606_2_plen_60_part_00
MAVDLWALGVTVFNWLTGGVPYWSETGSEIALYDKISTQPWSLPPREPALSPVSAFLLS